MNPILPTIITGPAIIIWNGKSYYSKKGIKAELKRDTFKVETDFDGQIDERAKTQRTEISFQPDAGPDLQSQQIFSLRCGAERLDDLWRVAVAAGHPDEVRRRGQHRPDDHVSARGDDETAAIAIESDGHALRRVDVHLPRRADGAAERLDCLAVDRGQRVLRHEF